MVAMPMPISMKSKGGLQVRLGHRRRLPTAAVVLSFGRGKWKESRGEDERWLNGSGGLCFVLSRLSISCASTLTVCETHVRTQTTTTP